MDHAPLNPPTHAVSFAFGSDYDELCAFASAKSEGNEALVEENLVKAALLLVDEISTHSGIEFSLHFPEDTSRDADAAWSEGANTIYFGKLLLKRLDAACLKFALWLTENFVLQNSALGPSLPLPLLKSSWEFPAAALELFEGNMLPKASDPTGMPWGHSVSFLAMTKFLPRGDKVTFDQMRASHGRIAYPLRPNFDRVNTSLAKDFLSKDPSPHLLLLYGRILSDTIALVLAHEAAHTILGHNWEPTPNPSRSREDEVAADTKALELLDELDGFDLRSAALLFVFLADYDGTEPLHRLSHPFASARFEVLVDTATTLPPKMAKDLNSASQALYRTVPVKGHSASLGGISARASADLEYRIFLNLEQPVPKSDSRDWMRWWELDIEVLLRDRVHPSRVFRKGNVILPVSAYVTTLGTGDTSRGGARVSIELPPSWWMDLQSTSVHVESVTIMEISKENADTKAAFHCSSRLTDDQTKAAIRNLPLEASSVVAQAAARAANTESEEVALEILLAARERLGHVDPHTLKWLGQTLLKVGLADRAVQILDSEINRLPFVPAGVRGLMASAKWGLFREHLPKPPRFWQRLSPGALALYEEIIDLAFREKALSSNTPEGKAAAELINEALQLSNFSKSISTFIAGIQEFQLGVQAREVDLAYDRFQAAAAKMQVALSASHGAPIFPKQILGETLFAMAMHDTKDFTSAYTCFEEVISDDPSFLPALTEMAKIHLEHEDFIGVRTILKRAEKFGPAHEFLHYVREEYQRRCETQLAPIEARALEAVQRNDTGTMESLAGIAIQIDPDNPRACNLSAMLQYQAGHIAAARETMERSLALQGEVFDMVVALGQVLVELGADREGYERLSIALGCASHLPTEEQVRQMPHDRPIPYAGLKGISFAQAARGLALARLGQVDRALCEVAKAEAGFPTGGIALLDCAEVLRLAGRMNHARGLARRALQASELKLPPALAQRAKRFLAADANSVLPSMFAREG